MPIAFLYTSESRKYTFEKQKNNYSSSKSMKEQGRNLAKLVSSLGKHFRTLRTDSKEGQSKWKDVLYS